MSTEKEKQRPPSTAFFDQTGYRRLAQHRSRMPQRVAKFLIMPEQSEAWRSLRDSWDSLAPQLYVEATQAAQSAPQTARGSAAKASRLVYRYHLCAVSERASGSHDEIRVHHDIWCISNETTGSICCQNHGRRIIKSRIGRAS